MEEILLELKKKEEMKSTNTGKEYMKEYKYEPLPSEVK